ncbi:MAG TPA: hypothetical protein VF335_01860, partial [Chitinivibrionales bacterium]
LDDEHSVYSKGLGLFFCRMVMNAHGGRIWLDTNEEGNFFKMSFKTPNHLPAHKDPHENENGNGHSVNNYAKAG